MENIVFERGISIPPKGHVNHFRYRRLYRPTVPASAWYRLKVGESFFVRDADAITMSKRSTRISSDLDHARRFLVRATETGSRVWRIS